MSPANVEPLDRVLIGMIVFLLLLLTVVSKWSPNDGQTFQVVSSLLTIFSGAFVGRLTKSGYTDGGDKK